MPSGAVPIPQAGVLAGVGTRPVPSCCGQGKAELQLGMALCSQVWWAGSLSPPSPSPSLPGP